MFHPNFRVSGLSVLGSVVLLAACGRSDFLPSHSRGGGVVSVTGGVAGSGGATTSTGGTVGTGGSPPVGHPWPVFGHDPQATRLSPVDTSGNLGKLRWRLSLGAGPKSSPVISLDGTVYVYSTDPTLYAVVPPTSGTEGVLAWSYSVPLSDFPLGEYPAYAPSIGLDGTVYVSAWDTLYAVEAPASGTAGMVRWRYRTSNRYNPMGPTTVGGDGTVYTLGGDIVAFDGITGALKWRGSSPGFGMDPPAIAQDGTVYSGVNALNAILPPTNGSTDAFAWSFPEASAGTSPAIAADGTIFVGGDNLRVNAITPPTGGKGPALKWSYYTGCMTHAAPAFGPDGTVYVAGYDWDLFALNPQATNPDGELKWRWYHRGERGLRSAPAVGGDGTIYVAGYGHVYAILPPTGGGGGTLKWDFRTEGYQVSAPAIGADGTVYVTDENGILYAIR